MPIRLLLITFLESFATICVERGVYFYTDKRLGFDSVANLWLALALGVPYVVGALSSHAMCGRRSERTILLASIAGQGICHLLLAFWPGSVMVFACTAALGFLNGVKWPVIESYVSAGRGHKDQARIIGYFNCSWALAVPMALAAAGPLILLDKQVAAYVSVGTLFFIPAVINAACVLLSGPLPRRPEHLPEDHADRPSPEMVERLTRLLTSNRWLMLASYTAMFLLAPLVPEVFKQLQVSAQWAPALSGLLDVVRVAAFAMLFGLTFWHGRAWPAVMSMLFAPAGFLMILFGNSLAMVLAGEVLFGLSAGIVYYAALYYAMAVKNASVEGGGAHEGLIGGGFAIGPALGLVAVAIAPRIGGEFIATLASVGPFFILCSIMAARPLVRRPRS